MTGARSSNPFPADFTNRRGIDYEVAREQILAAIARTSAAMGWEEDEGVLDTDMNAAYRLQMDELHDELNALDPFDYPAIEASIEKWRKILIGTTGAWTPTSHRPL